MLTLSLILLPAWSAPLPAEAPHVPPPHRLTDWSAPLQVDAPGTRAGMIVQTVDDRPVSVQVWQGEEWVTARETWRSGEVAVLVADLGVATDTARLRSRDAARIVTLDWDLLTPIDEPRLEGAAPPSPGVLPGELVDIGVISRAEWGSRSTNCSSLEDDWYRMAIHHTAGSQTYGGTVEGTVHALQSYAMDSGGFCDIPYQFLVGYDGSLWEGRPYGYYSGATGGGNNDGNIAVSFLGCYHPSDCATSHSVTDAMMSEGQLLVQTLVALHAIPSDEDSIRGHRDWPDNSTACPGDWLYDRLDELRAPLDPVSPSYAAELEAADCDATTVEEGDAVTCAVTFLNTGRADWTPDTTKLGTLPRDAASPLADGDWLSSSRPAAVSTSTAPGEVGSFVFPVYGATIGEYTLELGLVEEGVTWFADDGGPDEPAASFEISVVAPGEGPVDTDDTDSTWTPGDSGALPGVGASWDREPLHELGCGCGVGGVGGGWIWALALLGWRSRRG